MIRLVRQILLISILATLTTTQANISQISEQFLQTNETASQPAQSEPMSSASAEQAISKFDPVNLSDKTIPLHSQRFVNVLLEEFNFQKIQDDGSQKIIEEMRSTVLQGFNISQLYDHKSFNLNNSLLVFQAKIAIPKNDDGGLDTPLQSLSNMSLLINSSYTEDSGHQLYDTKVSFKKQASSDQDVEQLPLDDNYDNYLAHIALTPCQYLRAFGLQDETSDIQQNKNASEHQKSQNANKNEIKHEKSQKNNRIHNLNVKIQQVIRQVYTQNSVNQSKIADSNQTMPISEKLSQENTGILSGQKSKFNISITIFAVEQNRIRNYLCQIDSMQKLNRTLDKNQLKLDSKISNHLNPIFSSFEYIPDENMFYAIGSGSLVNGEAIQGSKAQQIQTVQKLYKPTMYKFDFRKNSWFEVTKQSDFILNTGQKVQHSLWPTFKYGQAVAQYFGFLIVFGAQPVEEINGQFKNQLISIFDTSTEQWFFVEPEDNQLDRQAWPSNFQNRILMAATPLINNGQILYVGGYQQEQKANSSKQHGPKSEQVIQQSQQQILILNIEFIVEKIVSIKNQQLSNRIIRFSSWEIWSELQLAGDDDQDMKKLDLNGHSILLLPELSSVLIAGGRLNNEKMNDNTKMYVLNLETKTLQTLEPWSSFQAILPARMNTQLSIDGSFIFEKQSEQMIRVSIQSGFNQYSGDVFHDHWTMDIDLESMKFKLNLNQAASLSPTVVPSYNQMISFVTYDNEDGRRNQQPLALIQQNGDLNFVILIEDLCSDILLGEYTNVDQATQQKYIACQNQFQKNLKDQDSKKCPPGFVEQRNKGLNYCMICGENKFFNFTTQKCEPCHKSMACLLGSLTPITGIKQELNKFNVSNNPSLYDTGPLRKEIIQESYFGHALVLFFSAFIVAFILIHIPKYQKHVIRLIVQSDFLMISGGDQQTFIGGLITIIYVVGNFFVILSLMQTKINLNEWIDSTQMAPQTSDLKVNNDLYVELHFFMNQVSLDKTQSAQKRSRDIHYANLCDLGVFSVQKKEEISAKQGRYRHSYYGPKKVFTAVQQTNCSRLPLSTQSIKHNTGEMVYNIQLLINDFVLDDPRETQVLKVVIENLVSINNNNIDSQKILLQNETVFLNYFSYQVQTIWNSINNVDENEVEGEDYEEKPLTLADINRNLIVSSSSQQIRTHLQRKHYEQRAVKKQSIWDKINPFAQIEDPETQRLRCVGCSKLSGKITSDDYQERSFSRNSQVEINVKATPVYYQNYLNYQSYQGYQLHYISMRYGQSMAAGGGSYLQEPLQLNVRDMSIFQKTDGNFQRSGTIPFSNTNFNNLNLQLAENDQSQQSPGGILNNFWQQAASVASSQVNEMQNYYNSNSDPSASQAVNMQQSANSKQQSSFVIDINFNLSENISQVRVSGRKTWLSMFAEILAFMAGLRFWATLFKYLMTINNIGRYYDRMHKIYKFEEESRTRKQGRDNAKLLTKEQQEANKMRYSVPAEDILSAQTTHTAGKGSSKHFDNKFKKRVKKNAGTSPIGIREVEMAAGGQLDQQQNNLKRSNTFLNNPSIAFPDVDGGAKGSQNEERGSNNGDKDDVASGLKQNYQWTPRNIKLPKDSQDGGDFELHVQTLNDNDEVEHEQSFDSNFMPIDQSERQQLVFNKNNNEKQLNIKYDRIVEDRALYGQGNKKQKDRFGNRDGKKNYFEFQ